MTAIVARNDQIAGGVYKALRDKGLSVPKDVSVVGCDDTVGTWLYPALSTTREFPKFLGKNPVEAILRRIEDLGQKPQQITVPTEFIRRDSCGHPFEPKRVIARSAAQQFGFLIEPSLISFSPFMPMQACS